MPLTSDRTLHQPRRSWYSSLIDQTGRPRYDVNPVWRSHSALRDLSSDIQFHFSSVPFSKIVAFDALGFILGGYLAAKFDCGFVPLRKGGKLPLSDDRVERVTFTDYDERETTWELGKDYLEKGSFITSTFGPHARQRLMSRSRRTSPHSRRMDGYRSTDACWD